MFSVSMPQVKSVDLVEPWLESKTGRDVIDGEIAPDSHPNELQLGAKT